MHSLPPQMATIHGESPATGGTPPLIRCWTPSEHGGGGEWVQPITLPAGASYMYNM